MAEIIVNVALLVEGTFPPVSRGNLRLYKLALALRKEGHRVYLISPSHTPSRVNNGLYEGIVVTQHIGLAALLFRPRLRLFIRLLHLLTSFIHLIRLRKNNLQIIHAYNPVAGVAAALATKIIKAKFFLEWTDLTSDLARYESPLIFPFFLQKIEKFLLKRSDKIITVSEQFRETLVKMGGQSNKIYVISDGVDTKLFSPAVDGSAVKRTYDLDGFQVLVFHGDLKLVDGIDILLKALAKVLMKMEHVKLLIVGGFKNDKDYVEELAGKLGIRKSVIFVGWIPHKEVPRYLAAACVGVMPLRRTLQTNCYVSLKLFEYWGVGKPVVVSRVKAISKIVDEGVNGMIVDSDNVDSLVNCLLRILSDKERIKILGKNGRRLVEERYDWGILMGEEARLYEHLQ